MGQLVSLPSLRPEKRVGERAYCACFLHDSAVRDLSFSM